TSPLDLLLNALVVAALAWVALDLIERRRVTSPRPRLAMANERFRLRPAFAYAAAGAAAALLLYAYEWFLQFVVSETSIDLLHFSLHPASATRLAIAFGLVLLHASVIWGAAALTRLTSLVGRMPRRVVPRVVVAIAWVAGALLAIRLASLRYPVLSLAPLLLVLAVAAGCAVAVAWMHGRARHASQATRLFGFFLALLVPAVAAYPSLLAFATAAKEHLVAAEFAPQSASQREDFLKRRFAT